jgi:hypothetical protein
VVGILPPEARKAPKTCLQPENVVDSLPPEAVWVVQTLPFMSVCSKKSKSVVGIVPPLQGNVVENRPFMSICSKKSARVAETEPPL